MGLGVLLVGAAAATAAPPADRVTILPEEVWSGVFGGRDLTLNFKVSARQDFTGRLGWSLSVDRRTLSRGETALTVRDNRPSRTGIRLKIPEVKQGAVVAAQLSVEIHQGGGDTKVAGHDRRLWIFSDDPFADRSQWLRGLKLTLFDPQGDTAKVLQEANVPFEESHNVASLPAVAKGVLVVGEGTSFVEHRSLPEVMIRLAAGGVPVVCLAPSAGTLPLPGAEGPELPRPNHLVLRRQEAITALDKRLDAEAWPPDGKVVASSISLRAERRGVAGQVGEGESGWPWMEVHYPKQRATLLICGFGIVDRWDAGPVPRQLFTRLLEYVTRRE